MSEKKKVYVSDIPELMAEWDYEKNSENGFFADQLTSGSNKKVWWRCEKGHEWTASINHRVTGRNCPFCCGKRAWPGFNDLATTNPELADEWNYDKNEGLTPSEITNGSRKKVWWKCKQGHEWYQEIHNRLLENDRGCPFCSGRLAIPGVNDLLTLFPSLSSEWNYPKNSGLDPHSLNASSNKKVWWICQKGHEWEATIDSRTYKGRNCPYCSNQRVLKGYNDLQSVYPDLSKEWNYNKNNGIKPDQVIAYTGKKYWWICQKGHEWEATVSSRVRGNGCGQCSKEMKTSFPEQAIFYYIKQVFPSTINGYSDDGISEIDVYIPERRFGIEYDGQFYHTDLRKDERKDNIIKSKGISLLRIKEKAELDYAEKPYIEIDNSIYYNPNKKDLLNLVIRRVFNILKVEQIPSIDIEKDRFIIWSQYIINEKKKSLTALFPDIAEEWNYDRNGELTPDKVTYRSGKKVWWKCKRCGTEWQASISHRTSGTGCPKCALEKIAKKASKLISGVNDLVTKCPEIAEEWNYEKNAGIDPNNIYYKSQAVVWWKCKYCGNEYQASVGQRARLNTMCNKCTYAIRNGSLKEKCPELLKEWDYEKNIGLDPKYVSTGSAKKAWWKCSVCGHSWQSRIAHRVNGTGCPECSRKSISIASGKPVYQYSLDGELIATFPSVAEAKRQTGISGIYDCCSHRLASSGGYVWRYKEIDKE